MAETIAAPQVINAEVIEDKVTIFFDSGLDTSVSIPEECFTVNYGKFNILYSDYGGENIISLQISPSVEAKDIISVSYEPPTDIYRSLRRYVPDNATVSDIRSAAVKAIYKLLVNNKTGAASLDNTQSNLGSDIDGIGYPFRELTGSPMSATPGDFILAYGEKEAVEISNIGEPTRSTPNYERIWMAIQDANALIDSYIRNASKNCVSLVSSNRRRTALIITRYYLDTVRRREDVQKDYEACIKELQGCDNGVPDREGDPSARDDALGIMRTRSVPQVYNRESGLGFGGWWTDPSSNSPYYHDDTRCWS